MKDSEDSQIKLQEPALWEDQRLPKVPVQGLPPLTAAGFTLTRWVLILIAAFITGALLLLYVRDVSYASVCAGFEALLREHPQLEEQRLAIIKEIYIDIHRRHEEFRTFWLETVKVILLNVFLPVLTALLGYIFGRASLDQSDQAD